MTWLRQLVSRLIPMSHRDSDSESETDSDSDTDGDGDGEDADADSHYPRLEVDRFECPRDDCDFVALTKDSLNGHMATHSESTRF